MTETARTKPAWTAALLCLTTLCLTVLAEPAYAQDPFGEAAPGGDDPFGGPGDAAPFGDKAAAAAAPAVALQKEDPLVLDITNGALKSPMQVTQAVVNLLNWGRPDKAKELLATLLATPPAAVQLEQLTRQFGSGVFLRFSQDASLAPEGRQFGELVLTAADHARRNSVRLAALAKQAVDASPQVRALALNEMQKSGESAVAPLVAILADSQQNATHGRAQKALVALGGVTVEPLLGVLESSNENLRALVIEVLGSLRARRAVSFLAAPHTSPHGSEAVRAAAGEALIRIVGVRPTKAAAEALLWRRANEFLEGAPPLRADHENKIVLWHWDETVKSGSPLVQIRLRSDDASLATALRLAADLYDLAPENKRYARLYLVVQLQSEKIAQGLFRPLPRENSAARAFAKQAGVAFVEATLAHAMKNDYLPAAIGAVEVLGEIGDASLLQSHEGRLPILLHALRHPNRRLVFATAQTMMRLAPKRNYGGLSYFTQTLRFLARSQGVRRVLVAHPRSSFGQSLVGMLNELGFEADTATNGREAFRLVASNPDYEFILLSDAINNPPVSHLIQWIRRDRRSASIPIGLLTREERQIEGNTLAQKYARVLPFPQPGTSLRTGGAIKRLQMIWDREFVSREERLAHAASAFDWIIRLLENPAAHPSYDLRSLERTIESGLFTDALAERAALALGLLGTPPAQRALVNQASLSSATLELRQAAAMSFYEAVRRRRLLLTSSEIRLQYDRYNSSASSPVESQQILAAILDAIESPSQGGKGNAEGAAAVGNAIPPENAAPAENVVPPPAPRGE